MEKSIADRNDDNDARREKSKEEQRPAAAKDINKSQTSSKIKGDESYEQSSSNQYSNEKPANDISQPSSRILESNTNQHPFFYYQNQTNSQSNYFSLHSNPNNHQNTTTLYNNYGTTLTVIIVLHLIYIYQWNTRRSRQHACTSYDQLVEKKQFYRAVVAIASHPPVDGGERDTITSLGGGTNSQQEGGETDNSSGASLQNARTFLSLYVSFRLCDGISPIFQRILPFFHLIRRRIIHPLVYGSLSGLPLLTFASHILWQCRALEELYDVHDGILILGVTGNVNVTQFSGIGTAATKIQTAGDAYDIDKHLSSSGDGYTYFRVLVALALTSMLLELSLLRSILKRLEQTVNFDGYGTTPHQLLSQRAMCSIASLATALLGVYDSYFPYAPPPVLPFVRMSSSGFSLIFSVLILTVLTHRIHPVTSIISGLLSGSLWSLGFTSFLGTRYWGNIMLFSLALVMLLSLKAQPSFSIYMDMFCPCIDYVVWDSEGEMPGASASQNTYRQNSARGGISDDLEMGTHYQTQNGGHHIEERFPLLPSQSSSMSGGSSSAIRGRVPLINTMESDLDGAGDLVRNNEESVPAASSRFGASLSRRASGIQ